MILVKMMSQKTAPFIILSCILCFTLSPAMGQVRLTDNRAAITAVSKARAKAFNNKDARGIAEYFTENAVLMAPGKPVSKGKEAVIAYYQTIFDEFDVELDSYYEEVEVSGDMAYGRGEAIVRLKPRDGGETVNSTAKYLNILQRQPDGSWKTTHDIWNSNQEAP